MIKAFFTESPKASLTPFQYPKPALGPHDLEIAITHCGICHSDLHLIDNDWGITVFPLVPGHEIVGTVAEMGASVHDFKIGQRVGIGWQRSSCASCEWCHQGKENLCALQEATCVGHFGGFADRICTDSRLAVAIPEQITSAQAAPLLCGGITVFSPFIEHEITATARIAVIGIGGLGHLALQFARAFGCAVTALTSSRDKEEEAKHFGAHRCIYVKDPDVLKSLENSFDVIFSTTIAQLDFESYLRMLRPRGKLCLIGALEKNVEILGISLINGRKMICGSNIGSRPEMVKMLQFAALHNIRPQIEEFSLLQINEAINKLRANQIRYRAVLNI